MAQALSTEETKRSFFDAEAYENTANIEQAWAGRAVEHMEVHFNLITAVNPTLLRLTPHDNEIYSSFKEVFPDFKLDVLQEEDLKSPENKKKWHEFCSYWKEKIDDALFGTLVRVNCTGPYTEENTIFVVRIQFLAIEVARNKLGLNNTVYENNKKL